ncbi:MAG TPA: hypothetical protein VJS45_08965 [Acidimicrobiia bacterium]|nr:hypothetical protein [Acidimicrobiia bacterium]
MARPLNRTERRLYQRLEKVLPGGEVIRGAVVAFIGPRPGWEGLGSVFGALGILFVRGKRKRSAIAVTDQGVVRVPLTPGGKPGGVADRYSLSELGPIEHTGLELWLELAGQRYWVEGVYGNELLKMRRLREQAC